ncbi:hypothetical protein DPM19_07090 [Actinomadura craniellae]|uniref:Subtilisin inhibitor domain-containing protein n=1 Tax=Actinomadura craniellae TaxID=2231787 RepID=A0A365H8U2_9ACTN|nr:SSI family serine proteinase inhibitor [Actinomadura craniellae]RAY15554.1 hypothetical protein DPM19_07090 [Actinomadura craniellae]
MPYLFSALLGASLALLPGTPAPQPASVLRLTVTHPGAKLSGTRTVELHCDPAGGFHPHADAACRELVGRGGRIDRGFAASTCAAIHQPVLVEAIGHWRGRPVAFRTEYGNDCLRAAHSGRVFEF